MAIGLGLSAHLHLEKSRPGLYRGVMAPLDKGERRGDSELRIPGSEKLVAGNLDYLQTERGPWTILVMSYPHTQPMRAAGSRKTDSETPNIATPLPNLDWSSQSDHCSGNGTQKKDSHSPPAIDKTPLETNWGPLSETNSIGRP